MKHPLHRMIGSADEAQLMRFLIQLVKAEKVIEIGKYDVSHKTIEWSIIKRFRLLQPQPFAVKLVEVHVIPKMTFTFQLLLAKVQCHSQEKLSVNCFRNCNHNQPVTNWKEKASELIRPWPTHRQMHRLTDRRVGQIGLVTLCPIKSKCFP